MSTLAFALEYLTSRPAFSDAIPRIDWQAVGGTAGDADYERSRPQTPATMKRIATRVNANGSNEYLRNAVMTASPEQLQLMLYDGAIRFARQAKDALAEENFEKSCESLLRAQQIVMELIAGLRPDVNAELCERMAALYQFVHHRLVHANMKHDAGAIDEALSILSHQRETWRMLIERISADAPTAGPGSTRDAPAETHESRPEFIAEG